MVYYSIYRIHIVFSLRIINSKNINKNILEISDQNRINIKVTLLYFSTNQLKTQNKNILENSAQKLIVTANLLESQNGTLLFARVKTGQTGTWSLVE